MTYDQWKTTDPADDAPVCEHCGSYLRGFLASDECVVCADELIAVEAFVDFYRWEPEGRTDPAEQSSQSS